MTASCTAGRHAPVRECKGAPPQTGEGCCLLCIQQDGLPQQSGPCQLTVPIPKHSLQTPTDPAGAEWKAGLDSFRFAAAPAGGNATAHLGPGECECNSRHASPISGCLCQEGGCAAEPLHSFTSALRMEGATGLPSAAPAMCSCGLYLVQPHICWSEKQNALLCLHCPAACQCHAMPASDAAAMTACSEPSLRHHSMQRFWLCAALPQAFCLLSVCLPSIPLAGIVFEYVFHSCRYQSGSPSRQPWTAARGSCPVQWQPERLGQAACSAALAGASVLAPRGRREAHSTPHTTAPHLWGAAGRVGAEPAVPGAAAGLPATARCAAVCHRAPP